MTAATAAEWVELGDRPAADLHAICLAFAESRARTDPPAVLWARSRERQLCLGVGQSVEAEVELAACRSRGVVVTRRCLGGGAVLVDPRQWCFFVVIPGADQPGARHRLSETALSAAAATFGDFGIACCRVGPGDLWVGGRKVLGSGGALVDHSQLIGASFVLDFDRDLFAALVKAPSPPFRRWLRTELEAGMTTWREHAAAPTGSVLSAAFRRNLEAVGRWRLTPTTPVIAEHCLRDARDELGLDSGLCGGRRVPNGIKVNQRRFLVEHGPVRAVLGPRRLFRLAVEDEEIDLGLGIDLGREALRACLGRTPFRYSAADLWTALAIAARGTEEGLG